MHTLLEYDGKLPVYVNITKGSVVDNKGVGKHSLWKREQSLLQTDSITIFQCSLFGTAKVFSSVIRHKENWNLKLYRNENFHQKSSKHPKRRRNSTLKSFIQRKISKKKIKKSGGLGRWKQQTIEIITNNFTWAVSTIAELYKQRWQIEIFQRHQAIASYQNIYRNIWKCS